MENINEIKKELQETQNKLNELLKRVEDLEVQLKEKDRIIAEKDEVIAAKDVRINELGKDNVRLTEENEQLRAQLTDLQEQLRIEDEKPYDVHDLRKYMQLQDAIRDLTSKLETLDARERKTDEKLLNMIQETKADVAELKDTDKSLLAEVSDLIEEVEEVREKCRETAVEEETKPDIPRTGMTKDVEAFYTEFVDNLD